jgi:hypothetical protein
MILSSKAEQLYLRRRSVPQKLLSEEVQAKERLAKLANLIINVQTINKEVRRLRSMLFLSPLFLNYSILYST